MGALRPAASGGGSAGTAVTSHAPSARSTLSVVGQVAVLRLDCPSPVLWDAAHAGAFIQEISRLGADPAFCAIVLQGPRLFHDPPHAQPGVDGALSQVIAAVLASPIPIAAAISSHAIGSGLELALACAGRVATPAVTVALPGIAAGRIPLSRSIGRLRELVGIDAAAGLLVFGETLEARAATELGLIDALASQNLAGFAAAFAASQLLGANPSPPRALEPEVAEAQFYAVRRRTRQQAPDQAAPLAALRALEAVVRLQPGRAKAEIERISDDLRRSPQGEALAYADRGARLTANPEVTQDLATRLNWPLLREAVHLLDEGATPTQVDRCLVTFGFPEGPFQRADRLGLAAVFTPGEGLAGSADWLSYSATLDLMVDAGRDGGPTAPGWYRRSTDAACGAFDIEVNRLLEASATFQRLHRASVSDDHVLERCLLAAVNGEARLMEADPGLDAARLDAVWTTSLGFPRWKGGPLFAAERLGLETVIATLDRWAARRNTAGPASPALRRLATARAGAEIQ